MSHLITHSRCPRCANLGRDISKDNLGEYSDGHAYCYSCGYHKPGNLKSRIVSSDISETVTSGGLNFPEDYIKYIPREVYLWLNKYKLTHTEINQHKFGWSENRKLFVMPVYQGDELLMWQGRDFSGNPKAKKYLTHGPASDILHIIESPLQDNDERDIIVVTEGLLDAIKVGRVYNAMPLWGSHMPLKTIRRLAMRFKRLGIWLDSDKLVEAVKTALRASQFIETFVVHSERDPKEQDINWIQTYVRLGLRYPAAEKEAIDK